VRTILVLAFTLLSTGCAVMSPYRLEGWEILEVTPNDPAYDPNYPKRMAGYCWKRAGEDDDVEPGECNSFEAEIAVTACVRELKAANTPPADRRQARSEIVRCMERKGWTRALYELMS
jgi:hypothetical protein